MEIYALWKNFYYFIIIYPSRDPTIDRSRQVIEEEIDKGNKAKVDETVEHGISNNTQAREDSSERRNGGSVGTIPIEFLRVMNSKGFKKRAPVPPPLSKEAEKEEGKKERKARGGRKNAGWNRWDDYYPRLARKRRDEKETRARAHVQGEKKNFPRLANCPNRRTNYHPESQQSVPFSFARILAFSPLPSLFLPMAPWEFPPCTFDLSQSQPFSLSLCVCKCLHGTPTWTSRSSSPPRLTNASFPFESVFSPHNPRFLGGRACVKIDYSGSSLFLWSIHLDHLEVMTRENDVDIAISLGLVY